MIRFAFVNGDSKFGFECHEDCPSLEMFESNDEYLEAPDIYDDYFRRYVSPRFENVQKQGVTVLSGLTPIEFWDFLMDVIVYAGEEILDFRTIESYENAREKIDLEEDSDKKIHMKDALLRKLGILSAKLNEPGRDIDSLKSFGSFAHLLTAGTTEHIRSTSVRLEITQEEDLNSTEDLAPFLDFFNGKE